MLFLVPEKAQKMVERNLDALQKMDTLKVDESKRMGPQKNFDTLFGLQGTFKKLDID